MGPVFVTDIPESTTFEENYFHGDSLGLSIVPSGVIFTDPQLQESSDNLYRPSGNSPIIDAATQDFGDFDIVEIDMDGQQRTGSTDIGADEVSNEDTTKRPLVENDVGPKNYPP